MSTDYNALKYKTSMGTVLYVEDGDTVVVQTSEGKKRVRLSGIDAPELPHKGHAGQALAINSKEVLSTILPKDQKVQLLLTGWDQAYDRYIGLVNKDGVSVNATMVGLGMAEVYHEYLNDLPAVYAKLLVKMEYLAKDKKKGIWKLPQYERPVAYRRTSQDTAQDR